MRRAFCIFFIIGLILAYASAAKAEAPPYVGTQYPAYGYAHRYNPRHSRGYWTYSTYRGLKGWWWSHKGNRYFFGQNRYAAQVQPQQMAATHPQQMAVVEQTPSGDAFHYYCMMPAGYYPYVKQCSTGWQQVAVVQMQQQQQAAMPFDDQDEPEARPAPKKATKSTKETQSDNDFRQFSIYLEEMQRIESESPEDASAKLTSLEQRISIFRRSLPKRKYKTENLMKDVDALRSRIIDREKAAATSTAVKSTQSLSLPVLTVH